MYVKKGNYWRTSDTRLQEFIQDEIKPLLSGDTVYGVTHDTLDRISALQDWHERIESMVEGIEAKIKIGQTTKADNETALTWSKQISEKIENKIEILARDSTDLKPEDALYGG